MAYEPKDGSGALFKNDKGDNPARPDYRGDLMVGGVLYEISAWIKPLPSNSEKRFMSLSARVKQWQNTNVEKSPPRQPQRSPGQRARLEQAQQGSGFDDMDDDIPF